MGTVPAPLLPPDVNRIIAAYYLKTYSIRNLRNKLLPLPALQRAVRARREYAERERALLRAEQKADNKIKRKQNCLHIMEMVMFGIIGLIKCTGYFILALILLSALTAHDIAMF